jgi:N-carbamoylputrescine amidase
MAGPFLLRIRRPAQPQAGYPDDAGMKRDIRIAAVVCQCPVGRLAENLEQTRYWTLRAKTRRADMVCFPEMNLTGYSNRDEIEGAALAEGGPEMEAVAQLARDARMTLLVGFAERTADGSLYASHAVMTPEGRRGVYRKIHLAPPESGRFTEATTLPVFDWSGIRFGIQLCYDAHFPELSTRMARAQVDVIFIPHASPRGQALDKHQSWMRHLPARAFDNGVYVVACNQTGDNRCGLRFPGNAVVFSPSGEILDARLSGEPGLLVADLQTDCIRHVRDHRMRYFLPNRRPGLYRRETVLNQLDPPPR